MELSKDTKITYRKDGLVIGGIVVNVEGDNVYLQCGNVIDKNDILKVWAK